MVLRQWMVENGYALSFSDTRCRSPFGDRDTHPSAHMNPNHIYDFRTRKSFTLKDFYYEFGVSLDYDPQPRISKIEAAGFKIGQPLFSYSFED